MNYRTYHALLRLSGMLLVGAIVCFVLLPVVVVAMASVNEKAILSFPPQSLSWHWFARAFTYSDFTTGFRSSLIVTAWASTIAVIVGTMLTIVVKRYELPSKDLLLRLLLSPLIIPHFTLGLGLLILCAQFDVSRGYAIIVACHVVLVLPFVMRSLYVSMENLDQQLERAAASLGASPLRVISTVTLPQLAPGLFGGWLFAAIMSFNEFTASLFITTQDTQTLPVAMYNYVREYADPTLAALSVLYVVVTALLLIVANSFFGLGKILSIDNAR